MSVQTVPYHWTPEAFLKAHEAGAFEGHVELVEGEVWPVSSGDWHGPATMRCAFLLHAPGMLVTQQTLPSGRSLPDPDVWVRSSSANPAAAVSPRISRWHPADVLVVVEVSDESVAADLTVKARLYGRAGYPVYWVVTREAVHEHTAPDQNGYRNVRRYGRGEQLPVRHTGGALDVDELLGEPGPAD